MDEHSSDPPPSPLQPLLLKGEVTFDYLSWKGESEKFLKRAWKYDAGAGLLKRGALTLFLIYFFKVYHFYI